MTDHNLKEEAATLYEQLPSTAEVSKDDIEDKLTTLVEEYQVPLEEARRSVRSSLADETDAQQDDFDGQDQAVTVDEIDEAEQWIDLTVKVVELWEPRSDSIAQVGLLGDETGRIKFTAWATSDLQHLSEGCVYQLENVVTDEYEGNYSVKLNSSTTITELDKDIEVGDNTSQLTGALVDIQNGSGLIKRCPKEDCTRVLQNDRCSEHGPVEGEFDLRIKAVLDDGDTTQDVLFNREATEELTDLTLSEAQDMAMDALDTSVVTDKIIDEILGQYYRVSGPIMGQYLLADEFEQVGQVDDLDAILSRARVI